MADLAGRTVFVRVGPWPSKHTRWGHSASESIRPSTALAPVHPRTAAWSKTQCDIGLPFRLNGWRDETSLALWYTRASWPRGSSFSVFPRKSIEIRSPHERIHKALPSEGGGAQVWSRNALGQLRWAPRLAGVGCRRRSASSQIPRAVPGPSMHAWRAAAERDLPLPCRFRHSQRCAGFPSRQAQRREMPG